jgi:hypothetical protein
MASLPLAKLLIDLARSLRATMVSQAVRAPSSLVRQLGLLPILLVISFMVLWPAQNTLRRIRAGSNQPAREMASFIDAQLPAQAVVLSTELEIDFFSERAYLHVPWSVGRELIRYEQLGQQSGGRPTYELSRGPAEYLVEGPYGKVVRLFPRDSLRSDSELVATFGDYDLYRLPRHGT